MILLNMLKTFIMNLMIPVLLAGCANQCASCSLDSNCYACLSCSPNDDNIYIWSCPTSSSQAPVFMAIGGIITTIHLFMLCMGLGVYHELFQNIQLACLVTWRYGFQGGAIGLQVTNFSIVSRNSFPATFGSQFIVVMIILGVFWLLLLLVDRIPHNPTVILIKRKKIIFPVRVISLVFNILLYSSVMQIITINTEIQLNLFAIVLAVLAVVKIVLVLIGVLVTCNWRYFQVDDPHYYVLLQQMTTKKWYAKNNLIISLLTRGLIIISFLLLFKTPQIAGIIMIILQITYTIYVIWLIRFVKIRYYIIIITGNILMIGILMTIYLGSLSAIQSDKWLELSNGYVSMILLLVLLFLIGTISEIVLKKAIIIRQIKSIYRRFIICQALQSQVKINKYDEGSHRQKVTEFRTNLLYHKNLNGNDCVQMSNTAKT